MRTSLGQILLHSFGIYSALPSHSRGSLKRAGRGQEGDGNTREAEPHGSEADSQTGELPGGAVNGDEHNPCPQRDLSSERPAHWA